MRKWNMMLLAMLLAALPVGGLAQEEAVQTGELVQAAGLIRELPELFSGVYEGISEGLNQGAQLAQSAMQQELTLSVQTDSASIDEGKTALVTVTAGNPLPCEANVRFTLKLPQLIGMQGETTWEAVLPAAQFNEETGELEASETVIAREITLLEGGQSAESMIECEMEMGTRFYRSSVPIRLCVPAVTVHAYADGTNEGRVNPGDEFAYCIEIINSGDASKDMALEMTLPEATKLCGSLPEGFVSDGQVISGVACAPAAQGEKPSRVELVFPAAAAENALSGDDDAQRLIAPVLKVNGERAAAARVQICGAKISARLLSEHDALETGEETTLSIVVVNSGLAEADVELNCVLPQGLTLADEEREDEKEKKIVPPPQENNQLPGAGEAIPVEDAPVQSVMTQENNSLVFHVHMDAAQQTENGVIASTRVLEIPVRAEIARERMTQQMLGASLAWRVDDEQAQLAEAVALSVKPQTVLGLTRADWNGVFWAGVLLLVTVVCLYAAVKKDRRAEDYCFE